MPKHTSEAQTRLVVDGSDPIIIDAESALDEVYGALADERRRKVLSVLTRETGSVDARTLARKVAYREATGPSEEVTEAKVKRVQVSLCHHHLPKLADCNLVEYNHDEKTVEGTLDMGHI